MIDYECLVVYSFLINEFQSINLIMNSVVLVIMKLRVLLWYWLFYDEDNVLRGKFMCITFIWEGCLECISWKPLVIPSRLWTSITIVLMLAYLQCLWLIRIWVKNLWRYYHVINVVNREMIMIDEWLCRLVVNYYVRTYDHVMK